MLAPWLLVLLSGCIWKAQIESLPPGATVELPNGDVATTPEVVKLRWAPFNKQVIRVTAPGYRTLEVDMRSRSGGVTLSALVRDAIFRPTRRLKGRPAGHAEFVLVKEHGPAGTWTAEEQGLE